MKNKKTKGIVVICIIVISMIALSSIKWDKKDKKLVNAVEGFELLATSDFNKEEVISRGYPTMLDIGGADCVPCKAMKPVLDELNELWQGKIIIKFVDYWKYPELANQFEFKLIPTQFFYDETGNLYTIHEGNIEKDDVINTFIEMGYDFNE